MSSSWAGILVAGVLANAVWLTGALPSKNEVTYSLRSAQAASQDELRARMLERAKRHIDCSVLTDFECTAAKCVTSDWMPQVERRMRAVDRKLSRESYARELTARVKASDPSEDLRLDAQSECVGAIMISSGYANRAESPGLDCTSRVQRKIVREFGDAFTYEKLELFIALKTYAGTYNQALLDHGIFEGSECKAVPYSTEAKERSLRRIERLRNRKPASMD